MSASWMISLGERDSNLMTVQLNFSSHLQNYRFLWAVMR